MLIRIIDGIKKICLIFGALVVLSAFVFIKDAINGTEPFSAFLLRVIVGGAFIFLGTGGIARTRGKLVIIKMKNSAVFQNAFNRISDYNTQFVNVTYDSIEIVPFGHTNADDIYSVNFKENNFRRLWDIETIVICKYIGKTFFHNDYSIFPHYIETGSYSGGDSSTIIGIRETNSGYVVITSNNLPGSKPAGSTVFNRYGNRHRNNH